MRTRSTTLLCNFSFIQRRIAPCIRCTSSVAIAFLAPVNVFRSSQSTHVSVCFVHAPFNGRWLISTNNEDAPEATSGVYAITTFSHRHTLLTMASSWRRTASVVSSASLSAIDSPTQAITCNPAVVAAFVFSATVLSSSPSLCLRSGCPTITHLTPISRRAVAVTSPL